MLLLLLALVAQAAPMELTHTGRVLDAVGDPVTGAHEVAVGLHTSATGGTAVWTETFASAAFDDGYFAVRLGTNTVGNPLDDALFALPALYVELKLDGAAVGTRLPLTGVPYAFRAHTATSVSGGVVDATEIRIDGQTVIDGSGALTGGADTLSRTVCANGQILAYNAIAGAWHCDDVDWAGLSGVPSGFLDGVDDVLTEAQVDAMAGDNGYALASSLARVATTGAYADLSGRPTLSTVATSGRFADLTDIPAGLSDGDDDTQLTEPEVDAMVADNGYALSGQLATVAFTGTFDDLDGVPGDLLDGDTVLTEQQVEGYVTNGPLGGPISATDGAFTGDVTIGAGQSGCTVPGTLRYSGGSLQLCDGAVFRVIARARPGDGATQATAAQSCKALHAAYADVASGMYWINPTGADAQQVFCDMEYQGGGWTLCYENDVSYDDDRVVTGWHTRRTTKGRGNGTYARDCKKLTATMSPYAARVVYWDGGRIEARIEGPPPALNDGNYYEFTAYEGSNNVGIEINRPTDPGRGHCFDVSDEDNSWGRAGVSTSCYLDTADGTGSVWYSSLRHVEYWLR